MSATCLILGVSWLSGALYGLCISAWLFVFGRCGWGDTLVLVSVVCGLIDARIE